MGKLQRDRRFDRRAVDDDLALRAARLLQQRTGTGIGADIHVTKRIPAGAGSRRRLVRRRDNPDRAEPPVAHGARSRATGRDLALELGADVPFFVHGYNAFAEGRGERLTPVTLPPAHYALIWPQVHVSTKEIFEDPGLTRNTKATKMSDFSAAAGAVMPASDRRVNQRLMLQHSSASTISSRWRAVGIPEIDRVLAHLAGSARRA